MTLVVDQRAKLDGQPGLHALVVGVSGYPFLPLPQEDSRRESFGMKQLSATALTAFRIYRWLLRAQELSLLPRPLKTLRLLLTPSQIELSASNELKKLVTPAGDAAGPAPPQNAPVERAGIEQFLENARAWRRDASGNPDDVTLFYFAGHGIQRSKGDAVMLLEEFGQEDTPPLSNAVDVNNLFNGMAPAASRPQMARTQFYFVDACRNHPKQIEGYEQLQTRQVFAVELSGRDDRSAPIFFAAVPDSKGYAIPGEQTVFSKTLIQCLGQEAGEAGDEDTDGTVRWRVTVSSLMEALESIFSQLTPEQKADQEPIVGGLVKNTVLCYLQAPPSVEVQVSLDPVDAAAFASLEVRDDQDRPVWSLASPLPSPCLRKLSAGSYSVATSFDAQKTRYVGGRRLLHALPPKRAWTLRIQQGNTP